MEKGKRIWVLLIGLFVFSQTLLANAPGFYPHTETLTVLFPGPASTTFGDAFSARPFGVALDISVQASPEEAKALSKEHKEVYHSYVKCKKKYKRIQSSTCKIKAPVRVATAFIPPIEKGTYTRPHFLLHLHHFLFRLTPF